MLSNECCVQPALLNVPPSYSPLPSLETIKSYDSSSNKGEMTEYQLYIIRKIFYFSIYSYRRYIYNMFFGIARIRHIKPLLCLLTTKKRKTKKRQVAEEYSK